MIKKITLLAALCLSTMACTDKEKTQTPTPLKNPTTAAQKGTVRFIKNNTINLRLRKTPDLEGAIIAVLDKDVILDYANDSTNFTTTILHNNTRHNSHWYKVKLMNEEEGWVYGALVSFLSNVENQKILTRRKKMLKKNSTNSDLEKREPIKQKKTSTKKAINQDVITQYRAFIDKHTLADSECVLKAMKYFKQRIAGKQNTATCDAAFVIFYKRFDELLKTYQQKNFTSLTATIKKHLKQQGSVNMSINATTQLMEKNALTFDLEKAKVIVCPDFDKLNRLFYKECSAPMQKYLDLSEQTQRNLRKEDPALIGQNIIETHAFILNQPDFIWSFKAKKALHQALAQFLQKPAFDANNRIKEDYLATYKKMAQDYASTPLGTALDTYIQLLEENKFEINSKSENQRSLIYKTMILN